MLDVSGELGPPSDGELDLLLDALMPRLVQRMQHALDRIKWTTAAVSSPSLSSTSSSSPSASQPTGRGGLSEEQVEQLVRTGVADGLQQLLASLRRTSAPGSRDDEDDDDAHTSGLSDPDPSAAPATDEPREAVPTPSMRLLGDVSLHPRTVVGPSQQLMKVWSVQNTGDGRWPEQLRVLPVSPAAFILESDVILFTDIAPAATLKLSVPITTPAQAGRHVARYQLAFWQPAESLWVTFGEPLVIDLTCKSLSTSLSSAALTSANALSGEATAPPAGSDGQDRRKSTEEQKTAARSSTGSREEREAAIVKRIVEDALDGVESKTAADRPPSTTDGSAAEVGGAERPVERKKGLSPEADVRNRAKEKKDGLKVEKGKDRSASVDSRPPALSSWFSLVTSDATSGPATAAAGSGQQSTVTQMPAMSAQDDPNLLASSPPSEAQQNDQALDWLKDAKTDLPPPSAPAAAPAPSPPVGASLRPFPPPTMSLTSKSASHSRSTSPALPPQPYPTVPPAPGTFSRSSSQSFPPPPPSAQGGVDILSPPLTPPVPMHGGVAGRSSLISKDDLMSWAGGTNLSVTNKQTGVQSQPQRTLHLHPASAQLSAAQANPAPSNGGAANGSLRLCRRCVGWADVVRRVRGARPTAVDVAAGSVAAFAATNGCGWGWWGAGLGCGSLVVHAGRCAAVRVGVVCVDVVVVPRFRQHGGREAHPHLPGAGRVDAAVIVLIHPYHGSLRSTLSIADLPRESHRVAVSLIRVRL